MTDGESRCFSVINKVAEEDHDPPKELVNQLEANLVPFAKVKDYGIHLGKCELVCVKT